MSAENPLGDEAIPGKHCETIKNLDLRLSGLTSDDFIAAWANMVTQLAFAPLSFMQVPEKIIDHIFGQDLGSLSYPGRGGSINFI